MYSFSSLTKPSFSLWTSKWCFARTEQNLNRGQIEFGSKLRAHKFEWLPSLLKCVFSHLLKVHEDFKGKIVKPSIVSLLLPLNTSRSEKHILNISLCYILSSPGLSIFPFSIVSPKFYLATFLWRFFYWNIESIIPGHLLLKITYLQQSKKKWEVDQINMYIKRKYIINNIPNCWSDQRG